MTSLVVTDLDGTLWGHDCVIPPSTLAALDELRRRDVVVIAATARNGYTARMELDKYNVALDAVLMNGAQGKLKDGSTFFLRKFAPDLAVQVLAAFRDAGVTPSLSVDHDTMIAVSDESLSSCDVYKQYAQPFLHVVDLDEAVRDHVVIQANATGLPFDVLEPVRARLQQLGVNAYLMPEHVFAPGLWTLLVAPADAGKWVGVETYCALHDIDLSNVVAIGDGINDVELLTNASVGYAMAHAVPELLSVADQVLPAGPGWSAILDYL